MPNLGKLLDFSTRLHRENSQPVSSDVFCSNLDPGLIDHILGKDDAILMKDAMNIITDSSQSLENRKIAFENLEMVIHLENMNMWEPLIQQLSSSESIIRMYAASVCGTAVQNNIDSQKCFLNNGGLEKVLSLFNSDDNPDVRLKSFYAIASEVRNNYAALQEFCRLDGWAIIVKYLKDDNYSTIQRKILFFIWSLLLQDIGVELVIDSIKHNQLQKNLVYIMQRKEIQENAFEETLKCISLLYEKSSSIFDINELMYIKNVIKSIREREDFEIISKDDINEISMQFGITE
ncbi:hypothetical protein PMAC_000088 [Pneumocystis sp. 'macacae']|nr:hypothetical protein PMAC_000088 [Pneumocystis sp. 'macacae']